MRKRLRKKKYLGEFQVLGFEVAFEYSADIDADDRLFDAFYEEAILGNGVRFAGGWGGGSLSGFVVMEDERASATEAHREGVRRWFAANPEVRDATVGPLRDAHHGDWGDCH